jgi:hypothetical protein
VIPMSSPQITRMFGLSLSAMCRSGLDVSLPRLRRPYE